MITTKTLTLTLFFSLFVCATASAAPRVQMKMGSHPNYTDRRYAGVWGTVDGISDLDYSLLVDPASATTYINSTDAGGMVILRVGNVDKLMVATGWTYLASGQFTVNNSTANKIGGGAWGTYSDRRLKKDIANFTLGLDTLRKVRPVSFKYNGLGGFPSDDKGFVGVIAQELEAVVPSMVGTQERKMQPSDEKTTALKTVDPSDFTYILINSVQELAKQNDELKRIVCQDHPTDAYCRKGHLAAQ
jgi:Chaperone of endosialidase